MGYSTGSNDEWVDYTDMLRYDSVSQSMKRKVRLIILIDLAIFRFLFQFSHKCIVWFKHICHFHTHARAHFQSSFLLDKVDPCAKCYETHGLWAPIMILKHAPLADLFKIGMTLLLIILVSSLLRKCEESKRKA